MFFFSSLHFGWNLWFMPALFGLVWYSTSFESSMFGSFELCIGRTKVQLMEKLRQNASFARAECIQSSRITSNEQLNRYMAQRFKWKFIYVCGVVVRLWTTRSIEKWYGQVEWMCSWCLMAISNRTEEERICVGCLTYICKALRNLLFVAIFSLLSLSLFLCMSLRVLTRHFWFFFSDNQISIHNSKHFQWSLARNKR